MPYINGRYYMNPFYGAMIERARAAGAERSPGISDEVFQYKDGGRPAIRDNVYRHDPYTDTTGPQVKFVSARQESAKHDGAASLQRPKVQGNSSQNQTHSTKHSPSREPVTHYLHEKKIGGSASWRNNNPANITDGKFARAHGAIGRDGGGFAIFPTMQAGKNAQDALWEAKTYQSLTIEQAGKRWTHHDPPSVQKAYVAALSQGANAPPDSPIWYLSPDQLEWLKKAQTRQEGFQTGITEPIHHAP